MVEPFQFGPTRRGLTRTFRCGLEVDLTVNPTPDGGPGELFVKLSRQGSTVSGLVQAFAVTVSAALQRGVPWTDLRDKYVGTTFEPRTAEYTSLIDAIARQGDEMVAELARQAECDGGPRRSGRSDTENRSADGAVPSQGD